MCFSLFRSQPKMGTAKSTPSSRQSTTEAAANHQSHNPTMASTSASPAVAGNSTRSNNFNIYSSKSSSISSRTSLSSLKDSLPENPHIYDLSEIHAATKNFLLQPISSSSSSSTTWKCVLDKKSVVVTQRKLRRPLDTPELRRKLSLICKFHHASLVKLHGATVAGNYIYLVYDYIQGANLSNCLRNPRNPNFTVLSNWLLRIQIAAGVADGLDYMHNCVGINGGYIHKHLNSSSIIIAEEPSLMAKICHFGMAQFCGEVPEPIDTNDESGDDLDHRVLKRVGSGGGEFEGTTGYMSPEFQTTGVPTLKSDVFAFGVVLLELLSGQEPVKMEIDQARGIFLKVSLIEMARDAMADGGRRLRQWVDRRLRDSYPVEAANELTRVALKCVQEDPGKRPDMGRVAGWISKLYLDSKAWAQSIGLPEDVTASFAPR